MWVKSTVMAMEISDSIIHSSILNVYRTSTNHPVSFKINFKINFHINSPNSKSYSLTIIGFYNYIKFFKHYMGFKLHSKVNIDVCL